MLFFASFSSPKPQQAQILQVTAPTLSKIFPTPPPTKRLSASSASSIFSSLGFKPQQPDLAPAPAPAPVPAISRVSRCTHQCVTRFHTPGPTVEPPSPQDPFLAAMQKADYCQRCHKPHYFRWVYVCDNCTARACHNCRPKWAERSFVSLGGILGPKPHQQTGGVGKRSEKSRNSSEPRRRSKRWSGSSWLRERELA